MEHPKTFSDFLRQRVSGISTPLGRFFHQMGISPDAITLFGLAVVLLASLALAEGEWLIGLLLLIVALPLDHLDGAIARAGGVFRPFGSLLDSTMDRYADGLVLGAWALYYAREELLLFSILSMVALHGSLMVSYMRAKAESLGVDCKIGLFTRVERLIVVFLALLGALTLGRGALDLGVIVLAIGTQWTAAQRLFYTAGQLEKKDK